MISAKLAQMCDLRPEVWLLTGAGPPQDRGKSSRGLGWALGACASELCIPRPTQASVLGFLVCETSNSRDGLEGVHLHDRLRSDGLRNSNSLNSLHFTLPLFV